MSSNVSSNPGVQNRGASTRGALPVSPLETRLRAQMAERILVLDGAMGTMIQRYKLPEAD